MPALLRWSTVKTTSHAIQVPAKKKPTHRIKTIAMTSSRKLGKWQGQPSLVVRALGRNSRDRGWIPWAGQNLSGYS